jgi:hypothetical protein
MKKSISILLVTSIFMSLTFITTQAQTAMKSNQASSFDEDGIATFKSLDLAAVNDKAEKNFKKDYHQTSAAEWSVLEDNSLMCRFVMNDIRYRAFYTAHGQWIYTTAGYDATKLDKAVYDKIKRVYYNSSIVFVNQIDMVNGETIYIVEIRDEKSIRKIRVNDDDMEVVQEFDNH